MLEKAKLNSWLDYPPVHIHIAENHHFSWVNQRTKWAMFQFAMWVVKSPQLSTRRSARHERTTAKALLGALRNFAYGRSIRGIGWFHVTV